MSLKTVLAGVLWFAVFHLFPRRSLKQRLRRHFELDGFRFTAEFSGRVALYRLAKAIRSDQNGTVALIPDYICNVVNAALEQAGFEVRSYATDEKFEPIGTEIERRVLLDDSIGILLTASVYGSSAFLDELREDRWRELIVKRDIHVVVDLCQDISLVNRLPAHYGQNLSAVVSFNDKSIPGVMGGGIVTRREIPVPEAMPSFGQRLLLYWMLIQKWIACLLDMGLANETVKAFRDVLSEGPSRSGGQSSQYAYSYCRSFPYAISDLGIAKIQIIPPLIGLRYITEINQRKRAFALSCPNVVQTRHYDSSPYLLLSSSEAQQDTRKPKPPYAVHEHPELSLRGHLTVIHNKGFCDDAN